MFHALLKHAWSPLRSPSRGQMRAVELSHAFTQLPRRVRDDCSTPPPKDDRCWSARSTTAATGYGAARVLCAFALIATQLTPHPRRQSQRSTMPTLSLEGIALAVERRKSAASVDALHHSRRHQQRRRNHCAFIEERALSQISAL